LVGLLRGVRDTVEPGGYLARNAGTWLSLTEAELSRARDDVNPTLWREAVARIHEQVHVDFELYARFRLAEALAATGDGRAQSGGVEDGRCVIRGRQSRRSGPRGLGRP
jgi:hypothetical protein